MAAYSSSVQNGKSFEINHEECLTNGIWKKQIWTWGGGQVIKGTYGDLKVKHKMFYSLHVANSSGKIQISKKGGDKSCRWDWGRL